MKKLHQTVSIVIVAALCLSIGVATAVARQTVPYLDRFEAGIDADWDATGGALTQKASTDAEGDYVATVSNGASLLIETNAAAYGNVWCQIYSKPIAFKTSESPALDSAASCGFYVVEDGSLKAWDDTNFVTVAGATVPLDQWVAFAVHLNYATTNYDIYMGSSPGAAMQKLNDSPLMMVSNIANKLEAVSVEAGLPIDIDAVAVTTTDLAVASSPTNVYVANHPLNFGLYNSIGAYYSDPDHFLDQALGANLAYALSDLDEVHIFDTNNWNVYDLSGVTWSIKLGGSQPVASMDVLPNMGLWINHSSGNDVSSFHPYDKNVSVMTVPLTDTGDATGGYNLLSTAGLGSVTVGANNNTVGNLGFTGATYGDIIYILDLSLLPSSPWVWLTWTSGTPDHWRWGAGKNYTIEEGTEFWLWNQAGATWNTGSF